MAEKFPIPDEKVLERTRMWIKRIDQAIAELEDPNGLLRDVSTELAKMELEGLKRMRADLELQRAEFEERVGRK